MSQRTDGRGQRAEAMRGFFCALRSALCALVVILAPHVFACSVCYGAPGDPLVKGANNGIMFLLGIVGFVQIGFIAMFWSFWRRARQQKRFRESLKVIEGGVQS